MFPRSSVFFLVTGLLLAYGFVAGGHLYSMDDHTNYYVAEGLLRRGSPEVGEAAAARHLNVVRGEDGGIYSYYGIGGPLVFLPFVAIGTLLGSLTGHAHYAAQAAMSLAGPVMTVLSALLLNAMGTAMGCSRRVSMAGALAFALCTPALVWTKYPANSVMVGALFLAVTWILHQGRGRLAAAMAGFLLSLAVNIRYDAVLGAVVLPLVLLAGRPRSLRSFGLLVMAAVPGAVLLLAYNVVRFGDPFELGYTNLASPTPFGTPLAEGLFGLLLSPNRGLFFLGPVTILAVLGIAAGWSRDRRVLAAAALVTAVYAVFYGKAETWDGGLFWGPRYLACVLPMLSLGFAPLFERLLGSRARGLVVAVAALSLSLQLWGTLVSMDSIHDYMVERGVNPLRSRSEVPLSPVFGVGVVAGEWSLVPASARPPAHALEPGGHGIVRNLRATPDFWPFYGWKLGLPALPLFTAWLAVFTGSVLLLARGWRLASRPD